MIDIKPLRYFVALAETSNFHRAAKGLHVSQPTLSRQIAALEDDVGTRLFERNTRQVVLTSAGESFYKDVKSILESLRHAETLACSVAQGHSGTLRIGFAMSAAHSVIPKYMRAMRSTYPLVKLELMEVVSDELPARLMEREIDLAVMYESRFPVGISRAAVLAEPLCVALPRTHPKARGRALNITDFKTEPFAMTAADSATQLNADILNFCKRNGFEPNVSFEVRMQQTMLSLVGDAGCIALVPDSMRRLRIPDIVFRRLVDAPTIHLYVAWNDANRNPCLPGFFRACNVPFAG